MEETEKNDCHKVDVIGVSCFFEFKGYPDRNVKMIWPGELPRKGETLRLVGRDNIWNVTDVEWQINVEVKEGKCERGVIIRLAQE